MSLSYDGGYAIASIDGKAYFAGGTAFEKVDGSEDFVAGRPLKEEIGEKGLSRVRERLAYLDNKSDPNNIFDQIGSIFSHKLDNSETTLTP